MSVHKNHIDISALE